MVEKRIEFSHVVHIAFAVGLKLSVVKLWFLLFAAHDLYLVLHLFTFLFWLPSLHGLDNFFEFSLQLFIGWTNIFVFQFLHVYMSLILLQREHHRWVLRIFKIIFVVSHEVDGWPIRWFMHHLVKRLLWFKPFNFFLHFFKFWWRYLKTLIERLFHVLTWFEKLQGIRKLALSSKRKVRS